jgi:hypothetical protein
MNENNTIMAYFLAILIVLSSITGCTSSISVVHGSTQITQVQIPQLYGINITKVDSQKRIILFGLPNGIATLAGWILKLDAGGRGELNLDTSSIVDVSFKDESEFTVAIWRRVYVSPGMEIALLKLKSTMLYDVALENVDHFLKMNIPNVEQLGYKIFAANVMWKITQDQQYQTIMINASNRVINDFMYKNETNPFDGIIIRADGSVLDGLKGFAGVVLTALVTDDKTLIPFINRGMNGYIRLIDLVNGRYGVKTLPGRILVQYPDPVNSPNKILPYTFTLEGGFGYMGGMTQSAFLAAVLGAYILTGNQTYYETYQNILDHWLSVSGDFFTYGELGLRDSKSHTSGHAMDGLAFLLKVYEFGQKDAAYSMITDRAKKVLENYFEQLPYPYIQDKEDYPVNYHAFGPAQFAWYIATYRLLSGDKIFDSYLWGIWSYVLPFIQIQSELIQKYGVDQANPKDVPSEYWNYVPYGTIIGVSVSKKSIIDYPWYWEWGYYGVAASLTLLSLLTDNASTPNQPIIFVFPEPYPYIIITAGVVTLLLIIINRRRHFLSKQKDTYQ